MWILIYITLIALIGWGGIKLVKMLEEPKDD